MASKNERNTENLVRDRLRELTYYHDDNDVLVEEQSMVVGYKEFAFAGQRFAHHINIRHAVAFIFIIRVNNPVAIRKRGAGFANQLLGRLIQTNHRMSRIVGLFIRVQYLFHLGHESRACRRNHPTFDLPRLDFVFFNSKPTDVWLMASA